ncbi:hypothetical protein HYPSUDRAFT_48479 [Hypholoma sublateritium FD-334 SS-4]|uniref:Peptidase A1 domain-containing protein n=1 Tax=Hypholoma sublateritium (strain FD-334 SS-4) TaxID=945553 RepID=A0A0D2N8A3_HYPSF|nr:hypothetical protein HYPSUDRAFT_48479 [Hypholoma sublateritium FD-334 SS-4]
MEGAGGSDGVVLPLDLVGSGIYDVAYTIPVKFSSSEQQFSLQVDTGSSDLWVASKSCSSSSCALTQGRLYDPSVSSRPTDKVFSIPYLQGSASGPIVWDVVTLGGYSINNQALAAASDVEEEPLAPNFSGILGLALPLNSIIAQQIPPVTSNDPDGAAWASNLFSITPTSQAPAARFLSLSLSRPGSDAIDSLLGIGHHPAAIVSDPSKIQYAGLVSDSTGVLFWKASVRAITVYVNGIPHPIALGRSVSGAVFPSAVLDSGVPLILTTSAVSNAIYGAIGITPSSDGTYYVPCQTPLNLTITLDNRTETPIHPLDLTAEPADSNNAQYCIGLIQPADNVLTVANNAIGDMVLGVPFLRNTYTVMAYTPPNSDGSFPNLTSASTSTTSSTDGAATSADDDQPTVRVSTDVTPALGLLALTDPTRALAEFTTVRVLNQPLSTSTATPPDTGANSNTKTVSVGGKKLAVGIVVLIGLLSLLAVCAALFTGRWLVMRRRFRRAAKTGRGGALGEDGGELDRKTMFRLARRMSGTGALGGVPLVRGSDGTFTEDELRTMRYRSYKAMGEKEASERTSGSERTLAAGYEVAGVDEFGVPIVRKISAITAADEEEGWNHDDTLVDARRDAGKTGPAQMHTRGPTTEATPLVGPDGASPPGSPSDAAFAHARTYSDPASESDNELPANTPRPPLLGHASTPSGAPLLAADRSRTMSYTDTVEAIAASHARFFSVDGDGEELASGSALPASPAGMTPDAQGNGTFGVRLLSIPATSAFEPMTPARQDSNRLDMDDGFGRVGEGDGADEDEELGMGMGMAGVGSAARRRAGRPSIDSLPFNRESLMSVSSVGTIVPGRAIGSVTDLDNMGGPGDAWRQGPS